MVVVLVVADQVVVVVVTLLEVEGVGLLWVELGQEAVQVEVHQQTADVADLLEIMGSWLPSFSLLLIRAFLLLNLF